MPRVVLLFAAVLSLCGACEDPKDPQTWIKKLRDPEHAVEAVKRLQEIGDPVAVEPLCKLYEDFESPTILKAIISFKSPKAIPTLIDALDFTEDKYHNATLAANALADLGAKQAVAPLVAVLDKKMPIGSRANLAKVAAIRALEELGDTSAVPGLIRTAARRPEEQDFLLNKKAMRALGVLGDPRAIPVLIEGLFMASTVQGSSFPQARVALVRLGDPAVGPLIEAMQGRDKELQALARRLKFREGILEQKTAMVLGDLGRSQAIVPLRRELAGGKLAVPAAMGVMEALGKLAAKDAVPTLISIARDANSDHKLRIQACQALTMIGDERALPVLLELAETGYIEGGYTDLREAAVMAYSRMVGAEAGKTLPRIKAMAADEKLKLHKRAVGVFREATERLELAAECKDNVGCYGALLQDTKAPLVKREKSAVMVSILPEGREALAAVVTALPTREPILRLLLLQAVQRIGDSGDARLIQTLEELARKDSKRKQAFLGADLATADKIALARVRDKPAK